MFLLRSQGDADECSGHASQHKGDRKDCDNHRGISLLSVAGKILARILLNHLNKHLDCGMLPESKCGFRQSRGTIDMIFATHAQVLPAKMGRSCLSHV